MMILSRARIQIMTGLLLATILLAAGAAPAQNRAGFFAGLNFANQGGDMDQMGQALADELEVLVGGAWTASKGTNLGLGVGGFVSFQTSPTFALEIEAQYIRRGVKLDLQGSNVPDAPNPLVFDTEIQLNYFEIPVLARFSPSPDSDIRPLIMVGPVIGFLTSANLEMSAQDQSESESVSEGYTSTTVGLIGSLGISAAVGQSTYFSAQVRYYTSLTSPVDDNTFDAKSSDFGVFVGMEFLLDP